MHTSSAGHLARLRAYADACGLALDDERLLRADGSVVSAPDADAVYAALGLWPTPVERREDDTPLVPVGAPSPPLVRRVDLRGALHDHTLASDGSATPAEMRAAAARAGVVIARRAGLGPDDVLNARPLEALRAWLAARRARAARASA